MIGRTGGDEFIILLPVTNMDDAEVFAARLLKALELKPVSYNNKHYPLTVSIGLSNICVDDSVDDAFLRADKALYVSKESGRNT